jgi:hypothetical protein
VAESEITWVATLVEPHSMAGHRALAELLKWEVLVESPHQLMFRDARGAVIEYCTAQHPVPDYLFENQKVVIGFMVSDIDGLVGHLPAGSRPVGSRTSAGEVEFQHVQGHDGSIFGLIASRTNP